ncbi:hypothetical protein PoB_000308400 [Plakobranchus ocellatus]|uniref:Uncharacterized protein n=1 Tax=Plakobranchus ocellatus TaxID=259542 RepID=A0AAV3Y2Y9_9GAST|nr:hypothetical protein PoB_000308400 [Plakobranchus ocellatus]
MTREVVTIAASGCCWKQREKVHGSKRQDIIVLPTAAVPSGHAMLCCYIEKIFLSFKPVNSVNIVKRTRRDVSHFNPTCQRSFVICVKTKAPHLLSQKPPAIKHPLSNVRLQCHKDF